jgi:hypothetical protein
MLINIGGSCKFFREGLKTSEFSGKDSPADYKYQPHFSTSKMPPQPKYLLTLICFLLYSFGIVIGFHFDSG